MDVTTRLQQAITAGEHIEITYYGGSRPGTKRTVVPLAVEGEKLKARAEGERIAKAFKLELIEIDGCASAVIPEAAARTMPAKAERGFPELLAMYTDTLECFGWSLHSGDDFVHLYGVTKLGKRRKHPAVTLDFEPHIFDVQFDLDSGDFIEVQRETKQPWIVRCPGYGARTSKLEKAFDNLLKKASQTDRDAEPAR
jgi:hypothetical protein